MLDWLRRITRSAPERRSNEEWVEALQSEEKREAALRDLRVVLVRGLRAALARRVPRHAEDMAEDFAQEALIQILDKLDTFRGEARFTTWAQKVAVRLAFSELRRKRWENISLEEAAPPGGLAYLELPEDDPSPEKATLKKRQLEQIKQVMEEDLSERQRTALMAVMISGMPIAEVARRMDTNRNALYKLLYDARQRMKQGFEARGLSLDDLLADE